MKLKKYLVAGVLLMTMFLSGCWSAHEVSTLGISVAIGIDQSEKGYTVSEQVINPKAIASKKATNEAPVVVHSLEGSNIQEIIARMTTLTSRDIYSSHLRMVVISEDVARAGISSIVDYLLRHHEYRTDFYFAIAKGSSAKAVLSNLSPIESIPGVDLFNKLKMSSREWAPTKALRIIELANDLSADGVNPAMTAVELVGDDGASNSTDVLKKSSDMQKLRYTDIGVFQKDKLVGWFNEEESKGYSYITNEVKHTAGSYSDGSGIEFAGDVLKAKSKIKASVHDNKPQIDVEINLTFVITESNGKTDVSAFENIPIINKMVEDKVKGFCYKSVSKAQELGTDAFGFGEKVHAKAPKYWATVKDNWNAVFKTIPVNIKVTAELLSSGDITKTIT